MTLRYYYRDNDGDVVEIVNPSRVRRHGLDASYQAEEGAVGTWELEVDDPDGTFNVRGYRIVWAQETDALSDAQHGVVWVGYTGERYISRLGQDSPSKRVDGGRTWRIQLHDLNTRLSWRINVGNDCDRPAETDLQRVAWLTGTNEMTSWLDNDTTYIDSTDGRDMDAVDYTGQTLLDVVDDCAQTSGRNYYLLWEYSGDSADPVAIKLWYGFGALTDYASDKKVNNVLAVTEADPDAYYPSLDATLNRSPSRIAWGVYQLYDGGAVYRTLASTAERFNKVDVTGRGENVKTAGAATRRADRYLADTSDEETDRIELSVIVEPADVNSILPGHRLQVHFEHLPGYQGTANDDYFWMRVVERTVRDIAPGWYELGLTLMAPALDEFPADEGGGDVNLAWQAHLEGSSGPYPLPTGPIYWDKSFLQVGLPWWTTVGPFSYVDIPDRAWPRYLGIEVTDDAFIATVSMRATAIGVMLAVNDPYTVTWEITHNGVAIAEEHVVVSSVGASTLWTGGPVVTAVNITCATGDVFAARISCVGANGSAMEMFRSPLGINAGQNFLNIKGGYLLVSNPTRYQNWSQPLLQGRLGMQAEQEPDPDPEDPIDYASQELGGAVQVGIDVGSVALVQEATHHTNSPGGSATATYGATPTQGSMLFAAFFVRGDTTVATMVSSGWAKHPDTPIKSTAFDGGRFYLWYKTAGPSESTTVRVDATNAMDLWIGEYSGLSGSLDDADHAHAVAATTNMVTGSITPTTNAGLLLAAFVQAARNASLALDATYTEQMDVDVDASGPSGVFGDKIVDPFTGSYSTSATSSLSKGYGWFIGSFPEAAGGIVWFPATAANDGDTGTSDFSNSTPATLRVALDVERLIYRMELDIGSETAGASVYELYGTDDATFATSTLLGTLTFTATGSFTMDSEVLTWVPAASYQYYELQHVSGGGSDREFFEVRLYSAVGVTVVPTPDGTNVGDIMVWNGSLWDVLPVGSNGEVLTVDTTDALDLDWQTPASATALASGKVTRTNIGSNLTIASTTWADVDGTNLTISATTGAHRVLLTLSGRISNTGTGLTRFGFTVDGTAVLTEAAGSNGVTCVRSDAAGVSLGVSVTFLTDALSAASHTFKPRWNCSAGTTTFHQTASSDFIVFSVVEQNT